MPLARTPLTLFVDDATRDAVRQRRADGDPTTAAIAGQLLPLAEAPHDAAEPSDPGTSDAVEATQLPVLIEAAAVACLLTAETEHATKALDWLRLLAAGWNDGELQLAWWAVLAAVVQDCCAAHWSDDERAEVTRLLVDLCEEQKAVEHHRGNPHTVTNNHWGVSHAGAAVAAMAAHGRPTEPGGDSVDMSEAIAWALGRISARLTLLGDAGVLHEGLGYMAYELGLVLPAVIAARSAGIVDLVERHPTLRRSAEAMMISSAARPGVRDRIGPPPKDEFGVQLCWNDAGPGFPTTPAAMLAIALASPELRPHLQREWDRILGVDVPGDRQPNFGRGFAGRFFALVLREPAVSAVGGSPLPLHLTDTRQGLVIRRDRYADGDDAVLGGYGRTTHAGGHKQADAGSLRFMALGYDWITGGGQNRPDAAYQSVVTPDAEPRHPLGYGYLMWDEDDPRYGPGGGVFAFDLRNVSHAYHERYAAVDFSGTGGHPVTLSLLDQIDDHHKRGWLWHLTFDARLTLTAHNDGRGFILDPQPDAGDAVRPRMTVRFLGIAPASIDPFEVPESSRTYQSGPTIGYVARPAVRVRFAPRDHLAIWAVMAVHTGEPPTIEQRGDTLDTRIGDHTWTRPFGPAIPASFVPGESAGLSKHPAGVLDYPHRRPVG